MRTRATASDDPDPRRPRGDVDRQPVSTRRLEGFTDGVFAIAATLLVLGISDTELGRISSEREMLQALLSIGPSVLNVAVSFLLLGLLWSIHVRQFEHFVQVDAFMIWLNIFRLLGVVMIPFVTSLNDDYGEFLAGRMTLPLIFLVILVIGAWQWFYASAPERGLIADVPEVVARNSKVKATTAVIIATAVVALSSLIGSFAFVLFALDPVVTLLLRRAGLLRRVSHEPEVSPGSERPAARG